MMRRARKTIHVALVDAHPVVRRGLEVSLARHPGLVVVSKASTVDEAFDDGSVTAPDVVVIDVGPLASAAREIRRRFPHVRIVVFASVDSAQLISDAVRGGVEGYLLKSAPVEELVRAIETVHLGGVYFSAHASHALEAAYAKDEGKKVRFSELTRRERQVLKLVAEGHTSRHIADLLRVSIRTVESHREHIARKLGIHTVAGLTRFAIANGLVETD